MQVTALTKQAGCRMKEVQRPERVSSIMKILLSLLIALLLLTLATPAVAKTHRDMFSAPCSTVWPALKDTLRNSGKYGIIGIDATEMTASYNIGGALAGKRINSVVLNSRADGCEMQVQTAYSGLIHNDAGDLLKRVQDSMARLQPSAPDASVTKAGQ
jgi:hypothetical protein